MTAGEHPRPLLLVSFEDPADVRRAWEALRHAFRCEYEDGGVLLFKRWEEAEGEFTRATLRHDPRADEAYRAVEAGVAEEVHRAESQGLVPTLEGRHRSRPSPNELAGWAKVMAWLLREDPAGGDEGRRLPAQVVVGAFNDRLRETGLEGLLVGPGDVRRFYSALRSTVPGACVESSNRTYISCVDWTPEAREWRNLPEFKAPYG